MTKHAPLAGRTHHGSTPCHHCSGSGWLDVLKDVAGTAIRAGATALGGPLAGTVAHHALGAVGMGRYKKAYDKDGNELPHYKPAKPKRKPSAAPMERNALVKRIAQQRGISVIQASSVVKQEGLWRK